MVLAYILVWLIVHKYVDIRQQTSDCTTQETTNYTTKDASFLQVETTFDLLPSTSIHSSSCYSNFSVVYVR